MSDIRGKGYGSTHDWRMAPHITWTDWHDAFSDYKCEACGRRFRHWYHTQPNIFDAMKNANTGECGVRDSRIENSE